MNKSSNSLVCASLLTVSCALASARAPLAQPMAIQIDSQPLDSALNSWALQAGYSLLVPVQEGTSVQFTPSVSGNYSPADALAMLLADTDLRYELINPSTVAIKTSGADGSQVARQRLSTAETVPRNSEASVSPSTAAVDDSKALDGTSAVPSTPQRDGRGLPEVLVKGGRSLNTDIRRSRDEGQPYVVFDRESIAQSGAQDIDEFLKKRLSMNTNVVSSVQVNTGRNLSTVNLRGLGVDETLVLIDGRRAAGNVVSGGLNSQLDINSIPLGAVERIEILPSTASGIYGGGATGGVVNIILRRDYAGLETRVRYGNVFSGDAASRRVDLNSGFSLRDGRASVTVAASWSDENALLTEDRDFARRARNRVFANSGYPGLGFVVGSTTNIQSADGSLLTLSGSDEPLGAAQTFIPEGYAGRDSDNGAAIISNAGKLNLELPNTAEAIGLGGQSTKGSMLAAPKVRSVDISAREQFNSWLELFTDISIAKNDATFRTTGSVGALLIPAGVEGNPFNQAIYVTTPSLGLLGGGMSETKLLSKRAVVGSILKLASGWRLNLEYTGSQTTSSSSNPPLFNTGLLVDAVSDGSIDVFKDTNIFSVDLLPFLLQPSYSSASKDTLNDLSAKFAGEISLPLPGGFPTLAGLVEHRREHAEDSFFISPSSGFTTRLIQPGATQRVDSLYLESQFPLISSRNQIPGIHSLDLQVAGRYDHYSTEGADSVIADANLVPDTPIIRSRNTVSSVDPTVSLIYRPSEDLAVRGSFGTGFLPPNSAQLSSSVTPFSFFYLFGLKDSLRGGEVIGSGGTVDITQGGSSQLKPEKSRSLSGGVILNPRAVPGFRASIDWTSIEKRGNINRPGLLGVGQAAFDELVSLFPNRIERGPASAGFAVGPIIGVDDSLINIAILKVEAIDIAVAQSLETARFGRFSFTLDGTKLISIQTQLTDFSPRVENLGVGPAANIGGAGVGGGALKWRAGASLVWSRQDWLVGWATRYVDSYFVNMDHAFDQNQGSATIPSQIYHDVYGSYTFGEGVSRLVAGSDLQFGVNNVLNRKPPIDVVGIGSGSPGYSFGGDPRLATYYVSIRKSFNAR